METWPTIDLPMMTAACEHVEEGARVACLVGSYGLCADCKGRLDARVLLVPAEPEPHRPVDWDELMKKAESFRIQFDKVQ